MKERVLGPDRGVVEASRDGMRRGDLTVRVLEHIRHRALKNADALAAAFFPAVKSRGVFA